MDMADVGEKPVRARFDQIEHPCESCVTVIIRIGNLARAMVSGKVQEQGETMLFTARAQGGEIGMIGPVHGENIVKGHKIGWPDAAGAQIRHIDTTALRFRLGAQIRRFADMPGSRAGAIGADPVAQFRFGHQGAKHPFGGRRPANITKTNEQNIDHRLFPLRLVHNRPIRLTVKETLTHEHGQRLCGKHRHPHRSRHI